MKVINIATLIPLGMIRTLLSRFPILYLLIVIYFDIQAVNITEDSSSPKISLKAIIVDDEPAILELLALQLEDIGIEVTTFNDAQEAFEYYFNHSTEYDIILSDIKMPNLDGPELLKKVRNEKKIKAT